MTFSRPDATLFIPDASEERAALGRCTHLGIGAHQDDLEFMALHGILECFQREDRWFGGITCTDGAGSARGGPYADFSDEAMKAVRVREQQAAAVIGQYAFAAQLDHPSRHAKSADARAPLVRDIRSLLESTRPEVVYTHNPFDKHATHLGVFCATLEAIRQLPSAARPQQLIGCEVWRGLDWVPDSMKLAQDVSRHPNLAAALNGVFDSQIVGGKRYDLAVQGRRRANATFFDSHRVDDAPSVAYAIDMSPLMDEDGSLESYLRRFLDAFRDEVLTAAAGIDSGGVR